mmetsp:Transcript_25751/g.81374  ORF Transcript_25751/g.81374 Transcript_25751/m.81374 type:complete len:126 (+) Transcript_25751:44-421(+)
MLAWRAGGMVAGALGVYAFSRFLWMDTNAQRAKPARIYSAEGHARPTSVAPFSPTLSESEYKSLIDSFFTPDQVEWLEHYKPVALQQRATGRLDDRGAVRGKPGSAPQQTESKRSALYSTPIGAR